MRYAPLIDALRPGGSDDTAEPPELIVQELLVYAGPQPPIGYSLDTEVDALRRLADERGPLHLYGSSYGGAVALAFTAAHPGRVTSLALDEPATDFSDTDRALLDEQAEADELPPDQRFKAYLGHLLRPEAEVTPPPPPPPDVLATRTAGLAAASAALRGHTVDRDALAAYPGPVHVSYGGLSNARWAAMAGRLSELFTDCTALCYPSLHHFNPCHTAEPERVAKVLRGLWARSPRD